MNMPIGLPQLSASLFGKVGTRADYVALGVDYPAAEDLRHWLEKAFETAVERGLNPQLKQPFRFVFCSESAPFSCFGVLENGRDRVGRRHPRWLCAPLPTTLLAGATTALLPVACDPALGAMETLLMTIDTLPYEQLPAALAAIAPPDEACVQALLRGPREPLPAPEAALLSQACVSPQFAWSQEPSLSPNGGSPLRAFPIASPGGAYAWLELHRLGAPPTHHLRTYFWSSTGGQLFIGQGPAHPQWFLQLLARPPRANPQAGPADTPFVDAQVLSSVLGGIPSMPPATTGRL